MMTNNRSQNIFFYDCEIKNILLLVALLPLGIALLTDGLNDREIFLERTIYDLTKVIHALFCLHQPPLFLCLLLLIVALFIEVFVYFIDLHSPVIDNTA